MKKRWDYIVYSTLLTLFIGTPYESLTQHSGQKEQKHESQITTIIETRKKVL